MRRRGAPPDSTRPVEVLAPSGLTCPPGPESHRWDVPVGDSPATVCHHRSDDGQVLILPVAHLAVLTILANPAANADQLVLVGREASAGLQRLFRGAASV